MVEPAHHWVTICHRTWSEWLCDRCAVMAHSVAERRRLDVVGCDRAERLPLFGGTP
jgi:hypothetical protein